MMSRIVKMIFALWPFYLIGVVVVGLVWALSHHPQPSGVSASGISVQTAKEKFIYSPPETLNGLCNDWSYWRAKILKYNKEGDLDSAAKARKIFQQINRLINRYPEDKVGEAMDRAEAKLTK